MEEPEFWVENLWLPIIVGVALLVIGASFNRAVRVKLWKPIGRGVRWLTTIRLTTTGRLREAAASAEGRIEDERKRYAALREKSSKSAETMAVQLASLRDQVDLAKSSAEETALARERDQAKLNELAREMGRAEGRAEAKAELAAERADPIELPRWRVREHPGMDDAFTLDNVEPAAAAADVSIVAAPDDFAFDSSTRWSGAFEGAHTFLGTRMGITGRMPVKFTVRYRDLRGDWREDTVVLAAPRISPAGPRIAKMGPDDPLGPFPRF